MFGFQWLLPKNDNQKNHGRQTKTYRVEPQYLPASSTKEISLKDPEIPVLETANVLDSSATLISKEDIYYYQGNRSVLLIKEGQTVDIEMIPKLINFGVQPEQFVLKSSSENPSILESLNPTLPVSMTPLEGSQKASQLFRNSFKGKIVIYDPNEKDIKRLTSCLTTCGMNSIHIYPVPVYNHLSWALDKYQPQMLFLDYTPIALSLKEGQSPTSQSLTRMMQDIQHYSCLKHIMITVPPVGNKEALRQELKELVQYYEATVIFKPVNRFVLSELLSSP